MPENSDYDNPISGKRPRESFIGATLMLGRAAQDAMFHDLDLNGLRSGTDRTRFKNFKARSKDI